MSQVEIQDRTVSQTALTEEVQAHLGQASKFANGKARNWSLFVFFRILSKAEIETARKLFVKIANDLANEKSDLGVMDCLSDPYAGQSPEPEVTRYATGQAQSESPDGQQTADPEKDGAACDEFRAWLTLLSTGDFGKLVKQFAQFSGASDASVAPAVQDMARALAAELSGERGVLGVFDFLQRAVARNMSDDRGLVVLMLALAQVLNSSDPDLQKTVRGLLDLSAFGDRPGDVGRVVVERRLVAVCIYEFLRQFRVSLAGAAVEKSGSNSTLVRGERYANGSATDAAQVFDTVPINIAFTHSGLEKLRVEENTLRSF
ncbi:MAG: hypothetical protein AAGC96_14275, partial [Pseudomonadota bacterium]